MSGLALIGSVELTTGAPFKRLADSWMRLRGWQWGVLGTFIVLTSLAIIMCLVTFFVMLFTRSDHPPPGVKMTTTMLLNVKGCLRGVPGPGGAERLWHLRTSRPGAK